LTVVDRVGASSYPAQGAGDALGERAAATSWRARPERAADARPLGGIAMSCKIASVGGGNHEYDAE